MKAISLHVPATPAFLTGTSSEYLGKRHIPKVIRERPIALVLGPDGSGKTSVAMRIARFDLTSRQNPVYLETRAVQRHVLGRVRRGKWTAELLRTRSLVLDGPVWLSNRPGVVDVLCELLSERASQGRRTLLCQNDSDGSLDLLMQPELAGALAVIGLRFPTGARGRLRFARRLCDERGLPHEAARGTQNIEGWRYSKVIEQLSRWSAEFSEPTE